MKIASFEHYPAQVTPVDLYTQFYPQLIAEPDHLYASGPISSGGAVRWREQNPQLPTSEIVKANLTFIHHLYELLKVQPDFKNRSIVSPHHLNARSYPDAETNPWRDSDYLPFWMMTIFRLNPTKAPEYWDHTQASINTALMNDHHAPRPERVPQFSRLEQITLEYMSSNTTETKPVTGIIRLPDSSLSLGSTLEQRVAKQAGIPVHEVALNTDHSEFSIHPLAEDPVLQTLLSLEAIARTQQTECLGALQPCLAELEYQIV